METGRSTLSPRVLTVWASVAWIGFAASAAAQSPAAEFAEFRVPDHSWRSASVGVDGSYRLLHVRRGLESVSNMRLTYLVTDRWQAGLVASQSRNYLVPDPGRRASVDVWSAYFGVGLTYYVEDHLTLQLGVSERQGRPSYSRFARSGDASGRALRVLARFRRTRADGAAATAAVGRGTHRAHTPRVARPAATASATIAAP